MTKKERNKVKDYLLDVFKDLEFNEELHKYTLKSKPDYRFKLSCSKIAELCKKPFDKAYWLEKKSKELGVTEKELEKQWDEKRDKSVVRGSAIHKVFEDESKDRYRKVDGELVPISTIIKVERELIKLGLRVIVSELIMYDEELGLCGAGDRLCYNVNTGGYWLVDWKTNRHKALKKVETYTCKYTGKEKVSNFKFFAPFEHLQKNKYYEYCMQQSGYKLLIERNTNFRYTLPRRV
jgi:hypothetical protein